MSERAIPEIAGLCRVELHDAITTRARFRLVYVTRDLDQAGPTGLTRADAREHGEKIARWYGCPLLDCARPSSNGAFYHGGSRANGGRR